MMHFRTGKEDGIVYDKRLYASIHAYADRIELAWFQFLNKITYYKTQRAQYFHENDRMVYLLFQV